MKNIYYIAEADFSNQNASTNRVLYNAKAIIHKTNTNLTIIGEGVDTEMTLDGLTIINVIVNNTFLLKYFFIFFKGMLITKILERQEKRPNILIYYGNSSRILIPLLKYCKKNKIKLIADLAEWYDYSHLPGGKYGLIALDVHLGITKYINKCDGVITISVFLENYYKSKGLITLRVPVLVDALQPKSSESCIINYDSNSINLVYAGFPGKKDLLFNFIKAVEEIYSEGIAVLLHLVGPTLTEMEINCDCAFSNAIVCHGKVSQHQVANYLEQADFSILLRPNKRYANAGFPTKLVESFNAGLPVICNYTSDIHLYLKNGYNGYVVNDYSIDGIKHLIREICLTGRGNDLLKLRCNAKKTAIEQFDYRLYSKSFQTFLNLS